MRVIEVNQLTKYYGKSRGIVDLSIEVEEGEIFGFIGPNGAGKSTTIRLLLSLIHPTSGSACLFGKDIISAGAEIRKDIGYLPSEVFYYEDMKVIDLLKYSASFFKGDSSSRIKELSDLMELELGRRIRDLSYGNKKKVGIVQGLLHSPRLLFLDEPTTGLHFEDVKVLLHILQQLTDKGNTIVIIEHHPDIILAADHIIDLGPEGGDGGGYVVGVGTPEELAENLQSYTGVLIRKWLK